MASDKIKVILFEENNARILINPDIASLKGKYVVNPNLDFVKRIPPHFWKLVENKVFPMSKEEQDERLTALQKAEPSIQNKELKVFLSGEVLQAIRKEVGIRIMRTSLFILGSLTAVGIIYFLTRH